MISMHANVRSTVCVLWVSQEKRMIRTKCASLGSKRPVRQWRQRGWGRVDMHGYAQSSKYDVG